MAFGETAASVWRQLPPLLADPPEGVFFYVHMQL